MSTDDHVIAASSEAPCSCLHCIRRRYTSQPHIYGGLEVVVQPRPGVASNNREKKLGFVLNAGLASSIAATKPD